MYLMTFNLYVVHVHAFLKIQVRFKERNNKSLNEAFKKLEVFHKLIKLSERMNLLQLKPRLNSFAEY